MVRYIIYIKKFLKLFLAGRIVLVLLKFPIWESDMFLRYLLQIIIEYQQFQRTLLQ